MPHNPIRIELVCTFCGKPYVVTKRAHAKSKFCSSRCFGADRSSKCRTRIICILCGRQVSVRTSAAIAGRLFCSNKCRLQRTDLPSLEDRLCLGSQKDPSSGCIIWTGSKDTDGYGQIGLGDGPDRNRKTHRVVYAMAYGEFDQSLHVLHTCDHPSCIRPSHLFLGTHADNMADMAQKGRASKQGKISLAATIPASTKKQIRSLREAGKPVRFIAEACGVSDYAVVMFSGNKTAKHRATPDGASSVVLTDF